MAGDVKKSGHDSKNGYPEMPLGRRRRRKKSNASNNWLTTYSDMVTLLLTFFVLLYSMSSLDQDKFGDFMYSIRNTLSGGMSMAVGGETFRVDPSVEHKMESDSLWSNYSIELEPLQDILDHIQLYIESHQLGGGISVYLEGRGLVIRITNDMLFESGKADLQPAAKETLLKIAEVLNQIDNMIQVEGHTDNVPIRNARFASNWELSAARALEVVHFLINEGHIEPQRLVATAYGEYKPLYPNTTPELRAKNRRVEIVVLRKGIQDETIDITGESAAANIENNGEETVMNDDQ